MRQEYLDLGQIRIDFPLSYQFIKEISIQEDANEHSTLRMKLVVNQSIDKEDILRLSEVPVIVRNFTDRETAAIMLVENLQRDDLNPVEQARGL